MTPQEIFDRTVRHLIAQGRPAMGKNGSCCYLNDEGQKCALGFWLNTPHTKSFEGVSLFIGPDQGWSLKQKNLIEAIPPEIYLHRDLLHALQSAHDCSAEIEDSGKTKPWELNPDFGIIYHLRQAAIRFSLNPAVINEFYASPKPGG